MSHRATRSRGIAGGRVPAGEEGRQHAAKVTYTNMTAPHYTAYGSDGVANYVVKVAYLMLLALWLVSGNTPLLQGHEPVTPPHYALKP